MNDPRRASILRTVLLLLGGVLAFVAGLAALHIWIVQPPTTGTLGFLNGLFHGATAPLGAVLWLAGLGSVKEWTSGWAYEIGFHLAAITLVMLWQTVLQIRTHRLLGRHHPVEDPILRLVSVLYVLSLVGGLCSGGAWIAHPTVAPPLFGVIPGVLREGAMVFLAFTIGLTGPLASVHLARIRR